MIKLLIAALTGFAIPYVIKSLDDEFLNNGRTLLETWIVMLVLGLLLTWISPVFMYVLVGIAAFSHAQQKMRR